MRVSEIHVKQIRVNQGLGVLGIRSIFFTVRVYQLVYTYITKPGAIKSITGSILAKTYGESHSTFLMKYSKFPIQCSIRGGHITFLVSSTPSCLTTLGGFIYTFSSSFKFPSSKLASSSICNSDGISNY